MNHHSALERYLPLGYFGLTLALVTLLLPTTLRPPPDDPTTSAEFSPDAPPDDAQESLFSDLRRGRSGTAGAGAGEAFGEAGVPGGGAPTPAPPRGCPYGFGNPPRQTESLYAPPCAHAFSGPNGGATSKGVSADEIRVAIGQVFGGSPSYTGPAHEEPSQDESAQDRTYRVYAKYFNDRFQLYGRVLRLYFAAAGGSDENRRAAIAAADQEWGIFSFIVYHPSAHDEAMRRKIVTWGTYHNPSYYYEENRPYAYSWFMDGTKLFGLVAELMCKQLSGKPAEWAGDPVTQGQTRKFGAIMMQDDVVEAGDPEEFEQALRSGCGESVEIVIYNVNSGYGGSDNRANIPTAITRMRAENVTTIVCGCDAASHASFTRSATAQSYYPEWIVPGSGGLATNQVGKLADPAQWRNAFGLSPMEVARPLVEQDAYRAYRAVDPGNNPHPGVAGHVFPQMLQLVGGLQQAGPLLTPESFQRGLTRAWPKRPPDPAWSIGGGYGPGDYTYSDYVSLIWWDPSGYDPEDPSTPGAYRHVWDGKRFAPGEIPSSEKVPFFTSGITRP